MLILISPICSHRRPAPLGAFYHVRSRRCENIPRGATSNVWRSPATSVPERLVQRVLEADVGRGELVDDRGAEVVAPEIREPADDDCLVVLDGHVPPSS
jgi:hypothetical protein